MKAIVKFLILSLLLSSCLFKETSKLNFSTDNSKRDVKSIIDSDKSPSFKEIKSFVFEKHKCLNCHKPPLNNENGFLDLTTHKAMIDSEVVALDGSKSEDTSMYKELKSGSMPIGSPAISKLELELVNQYIKAGSPLLAKVKSSNNDGVPSEEESENQAEVPITVETAEVNFDNLNKFIIKKHNCTKCHNDRRAKAGVNLASKEAMINSEYVIDLDTPEESSLLTSISLYPDGTSDMPPLDWGEPSPVTPQEVEFVKKFIQACRKNGETINCP